MLNHSNLKKLREVLPSEKEIPLQDVNSLHINSEGQLREVGDVLIEIGLLKPEKASRLAEIALCRLNENIDSHEDRSFIRVNGYLQQVLLVVLNEKSSTNKKPDSPWDSHFFYNGKLEKINKGEYRWFNASKEHAFFPRSQSFLASFWFAQRT